MAFSWKDKAEGNRAPKLPPGQMALTISRILFTGKDEQPLKSTNGDPQIRLIYTSEEGQEGMQTVTLSESAAFVLAGILKAIGCNLEEMDADKVTPSHFARPSFASAQLLGKSFKAQVDYKENSQYPDITPMGPATVAKKPVAKAPASKPKPAEGAAAAFDADDIPF
jgi:hypothetical protein